MEQNKQTIDVDKVILKAKDSIESGVAMLRKVIGILYKENQRLRADLDIYTGKVGNRLPTDDVALGGGEIIHTPEARPV